MFYESSKYAAELAKLSSSPCREALIHLWEYMPRIRDHEEMDMQIGLFKQGVKALLMKAV